MLLDQRRAGDPVAGLERAAVIGRRVDEAGAREVDGTRAAERPGLRLRPAFRDVLEGRLAHLADNRAAQADDLGLFVRDRKAVARLMHRVKAALDAVAVLRPEQLQRQGDRGRTL